MASISSQRGHAAFAVQYNKVGSTATPALTAGGGYIISSGFQRHKMATVDIAAIERVSNLLPAIGGGLYVDGQYMAGVVVAGSLAMEPRLQNSLGHLLFAALGAYASTASGGAVGFINRFFVSDSAQQYLPWITVRRYTPDSTGTAGVTEHYVDCKIDTMRLTIPADGVLGAEFSVVGRRPLGTLVTEDSTGGAYESPVGVALSLASTATFTFNPVSVIRDSTILAGTTLTANATSNGIKLTGIEIVQANGLSGIKEETVVGSQYLDDLVPLARATQIRIGLKWEDPALYDRMMYAASTGTKLDWNPAIQTGSVSITVASAANIGSPFTHPYKAVIQTGSVSWSMTAPKLIPGRILTAEVIGTVTQTQDGTNEFWIDLYNTQPYVFTS